LDLGRVTLSASTPPPANPGIARGLFITIEGGEGAGKSTQTGLLVAALTRHGFAAERTREPGGSSGAEDIRRLLLEGDRERWDAVCEALLLNAARRDHVERLIRPALDAGTWIIADRFSDSTLAYQGYGRGLALDELRSLHRLALGDFEPDLTLMLDLPVEVGFARLGRRSMIADRFEQLEQAFHRRLREGFLEIARADPKRCVIIDATGDTHSVHRAILVAISERLRVALHQ
jgi:dTMP kinase